MTEQRDPLQALHDDLIAWLSGGVRTQSLETVLRARVLPLVEAAQNAEAILAGSEYTEHVIVANDLTKALRALAGEAVKL